MSGPSRFPDPLNLGNAWNTIEDKSGTMRYLSDQWDRRIFGFERRNVDGMAVHLAQSPSTAIGHLAFGAGSMMVKRPWQNDYRFHARWHRDLFQMEGRIGADASAVAYLRHQDSLLRALPTVFAGNALGGSVVAADLEPDSRLFQTLQAEIRAMHTAATKIGRDLLVDRVTLALYSGDAGATRVEVLAGYGRCAAAIRAEISAVTGQMALPVITVSQSATPCDATVAEGWLDVEYYAQQFVVATPKYHLETEKGSTRLTPESAAYVTEMEVLATDARLQNKDWYCPHLTEAHIEGKTITVHVLSDRDQTLEFDTPDHHGFTLSGDTGKARITQVQITDPDRITITLSHDPAGDVHLCYAFDTARTPATLRDSWKSKALYDPSVTLRRYALATRLPVYRN